MKSLKQAVMAFVREEEGLTAVEYAVAGGVIVVGLVGAFKLLGGKVKGIIDWITGELVVPA